MALTNRILVKAERFFKVDVRYLLQGTLWSSLAQVVITLSALALSMVLSRYLPKEVYGHYKYVLSLVSLISIFSLSNLNYAVLQSASRGFDGSIIEGFWASLKWSALIFLGALGLSVYYFVQGNWGLAVGILIGGALGPLITAGSLTSSFLIAKKDFEGLAVHGSIIGSFIPAAALMTTALLSQNYLIFVAVYFVTTAGVYLYLYHYALRQHHPNPENRDPGMINYAKHLSFMGILGGLAGNIDQVLLFHYVGPIQLALYNFAIGVPDQLKGPLKNLDGMFQARFANHLPTDIRKSMQTKTILLFIFAVVCVAIYIPLTPIIYHLLFPNYLDAVPYSQWYSLTLLAMPFIPSASYLSSKRLIREQYWYNALSNGFRIAFIAIGVIGWGLAGLIGAIIASRFAGGLTSYVLYRIASGKEVAPPVV